MSSFRLRHPLPEEVRAAARVVIAHEVALYGNTTFREEDLDPEWQELELGRNVWVADAGGEVVGYASLQERGELARGELHVVPAAAADVRPAIAALLEQAATERGARRLQVGVLEPDELGRGVFAARGYRPVRVFRELRLELDAPPPPPVWPVGLEPAAFEPDRDARAFHAAHQEAFSDHWEHRARPFGDWWKRTSEWTKFDPSLWCVVRDGDEIVAGAINEADVYGGGWVAALFTRRPWRGRGVAGALLQDAFAKLWERGERSVGLGVDADGETGAFRVYERAGMQPVIGWAMYEQDLDG